MVHGLIDIATYAGCGGGLMDYKYIVKNGGIGTE
jgi:hypothetical protein